MAKMHKAKGKMRQRSWQSVLVLILVCFSRMFFWPTTCRNLVWFLFTVVVHAHWKHWECCEVLPTRHWLGCLVRASSKVYGDLIFPISSFFIFQCRVNSAVLSLCPVPSQSASASASPSLSPTQSPSASSSLSASPEVSPSSSQSTASSMGMKLTLPVHLHL